jgi:hypothetical protein
MPISTDALSGEVSVRPKYDRGGLIAAPWHPATSGRRPFRGAPVAGAPGWYVVSRTAPVLSGYPIRWLRRLTAVVVTVGLVALVVLVLSMVRAHWSEGPAGQTVVVPIPPLAISLRPAPAPAPNTPIKEPGRPQDTSATAALQTRADPALPDEFTLLPLEPIEALERLTAEWESRPRPVVAAPSATRLPSTIDGSPTRAQASRREPVQPSRSSPQVGDDPAKPGSTAKPHMASEASTADDRPALPAGEIRIFIHHVADQREAASAQRLADYLRGQGFTVADIRPVDFSIGKPSVRYFFARDHAASQRLVEQLARFFEGRTSLAPDQASDFTHFLPKPRPGNVEVWLPAS